MKVTAGRYSTWTYNARNAQTTNSTGIKKTVHKKTGTVAKNTVTEKAVREARVLYAKNNKNTKNNKNNKNDKNTKNNKNNKSTNNTKSSKDTKGRAAAAAAEQKKSTTTGKGKKSTVGTGSKVNAAVTAKCPGLGSGTSKNITMPAMLPSGTKISRAQPIGIKPVPAMNAQNKTAGIAAGNTKINTGIIGSIGMPVTTQGIGNSLSKPQVLSRSTQPPSAFNTGSRYLPVGNSKKNIWYDQNTDNWLLNGDSTKGKDGINAETVLGVVQTTLDVVGLIPGVGDVADLANAAIYAVRGDAAMVTVSLASALPVAGTAVAGSKLGVKVAKAAVELREILRAREVVQAIGKAGISIVSTTNQMIVSVTKKTTKEGMEQVQKVIRKVKEEKAAKEVKEEVILKSGSGTKISLPENDAQLKHIFREGNGHIIDTPRNRSKILDVANDKRNYLGKDARGNDWYAKIESDGSQIWVRTRNGKVDNAGINTAPRTWDDETGLYNNTRRE